MAETSKFKETQHCFLSSHTITHRLQVVLISNITFKRRQKDNPCQRHRSGKKMKIVTETDCFVTAALDHVEAVMQKSSGRH